MSNPLFPALHADISATGRTIWRRDDIAAYEKISPDEASRRYRPGRAGISTATYAALRASREFTRLSDGEKRRLRM